jgi:hypothetical protein
MFHRRFYFTLQIFVARSKIYYAPATKILYSDNFFGVAVKNVEMGAAVSAKKIYDDVCDVS